MAHKAGALTAKQEKFVNLFLELGSAEEAAERSGYRRGYAYGLMRRPAVKAYLDRRREEVRAKGVAGADEVLRFLTAVMRGEIDGEKATSATPRMKAAELLGKRLGVFSETADAPAIAPVIVDDL